MQNNFNWAFLGTDEFSVLVLDEMKKNGYLPSLLVTLEDKPKGRKLVMTSPEVKEWADREKIKVLQLKTLKTQEAFDSIVASPDKPFDFFVVASYGKIIPQNILDIPKYKTLNVHPSLLPKLRGASPIQSAILGESETGVTIMRLDSEMDHGPIVAQEKIKIEWPPYSDELEKICGELGGKILSRIIPDWISGKVNEVPQEHNKATFCNKIEKSDAELNMEDEPEKNLRKIRAFNVWPGAFYFDKNGEKKTRIIVKKAHLENNVLVVERVIPEGKKEMDFFDYLRGKRN